jgi:hypothetical protein
LALNLPVGIKSPKTPYIDPSTSSTPTRRSDLVVDHPALQLHPNQVLGEHHVFPLVLLR